MLSGNLHILANNVGHIRYDLFAEHFVIHLATMLEHIANGALTVVNGKGNSVLGDCSLAEVINIVFNVIDLHRHGGIKPA